MAVLINKVVKKGGVLCLSIALLLAPMAAYAHLMKANHGTLKFQDNGVFMVLSLPASAFESADEDSDNRLSSKELSTHHSDILKSISKRVVLSTKQVDYQLQGILITAITPHHAPSAPADRIVVLGKFQLDDRDQALQFKVELFGKHASEQEIAMRASRPSENLEQRFKVSLDANRATLDFN